MSHVLLLGQMLCSGFSLHLRWPLLLLSYKHLDTWDSFLSSFAVQPRYLSVQTLLITHCHPKKQKQKSWHCDDSTALFHCWTDNRDLNCLWIEMPPLSPTPLCKTIFWECTLAHPPSSDTAFSTPTCAQSANTWVTGTENGAERTLTTLLPKFHSVNPHRCQIYNTDATPQVSIHLTHHSVTEWPLVQTSLHLSTHPAISVTFRPPSSSPVSKIWQLLSVSSGCWSRTGPGQPRGRRQRQHQQRQSGRVRSSSPLRQTPPVPSGN